MRIESSRYFIWINAKQDTLIILLNVQIIFMKINLSIKNWISTRISFCNFCLIAQFLFDLASQQESLNNVRSGNKSWQYCTWVGRTVQLHTFTKIYSVIYGYGSATIDICSTFYTRNVNRRRWCFQVWPALFYARGRKGEEKKKPCHFTSAQISSTLEATLRIPCRIVTRRRMRDAFITETGRRQQVLDGGDAKAPKCRSARLEKVDNRVPSVTISFLSRNYRCSVESRVHA